MEKPFNDDHEYHDSRETNEQSEDCIELSEETQQTPKPLDEKKNE